MSAIIIKLKCELKYSICTALIQNQGNSRIKNSVKVALFELSFAQKHFIPLLSLIIIADIREVSIRNILNIIDDAVEM